MKNLKFFLVPIILIGILFTALFFCACNNDSNNDGTSSGNIPSGKPTKPTLPGQLFPSKEPTTEEPSSGEPEESSLKDADWIEVYAFRTLSLKLDIFTPIYSAVFQSAEDLLKICNEDSSPIFEKSKDSSKNKDAIEILKKYDEEFFKDKSLVILLESAGMRHDCYVKNFEITDNCLNLKLIIEMDANSFYPAISVDYMYILEFPKEQLKDVKNVNVDKINKKIKHI